MNSLGRFAKFPAVGAEKYAMTRVVLGVAWLGVRQGRARQGGARRDRSWQGSEQGTAWPGRARRGSARHGKAWLGTRRCKAGQSWARLGGARQGSEQGVAQQGSARRGAARQGDLGASVNHPFDTRQTSEPKNRCKHKG